MYEIPLNTKAWSDESTSISKGWPLSSSLPPLYYVIYL